MRLYYKCEQPLILWISSGDIRQYGQPSRSVKQLGLVISTSAVQRYHSQELHSRQGLWLFIKLAIGALALPLTNQSEIMNLMWFEASVVKMAPCYDGGGLKLKPLIEKKWKKDNIKKLEILLRLV